MTVVVLIILIIIVQIRNKPNTSSHSKRLIDNPQPSHYPNSEWYHQLANGRFADTIIRYKITEEEVYDMYQNLVRIQMRSRYFFYPNITPVSLSKRYFNFVDRNDYVRWGFVHARGIKHDEIYNEIVQLSTPLKDHPSLYKWYWDQMTTSTGQDLYRLYGMNHKQLVNYLIEHNHHPDTNDVRTVHIIDIARAYLRDLKNGSNSNPLWTLARWTIGDFFE